MRIRSVGYFPKTSETSSKPEGGGISTRTTSSSICPEGHSGWSGWASCMSARVLAYSCLRLTARTGWRCYAKRSNISIWSWRWIMRKRILPFRRSYNGIRCRAVWTALPAWRRFCSEALICCGTPPSNWKKVSPGFSKRFRCWRQPRSCASFRSFWIMALSDLHDPGNHSNDRVQQHPLFQPAF